MADLTATEVPINGGVADIASALTAAASGGDTAPIEPGVFFYMTNGDASPHTATISTPGTVNGLAIADATLVVAAGDSGVIPMSRVFRGATGRASITYDAVTSVTVGVFKLELDK